MGVFTKGEGMNWDWPLPLRFAAILVLIVAWPTIRALGEANSHPSSWIRMCVRMLLGPKVHTAPLRLVLTILMFVASVAAAFYLLT